MHFLSSSLTFLEDKHEKQRNISITYQCYWVGYKNRLALNNLLYHRQPVTDFFKKEKFLSLSRANLKKEYQRSRFTVTPNGRHNTKHQTKQLTQPLLAASSASLSWLFLQDSTAVIRLLGGPLSTNSHQCLVLNSVDLCSQSASNHHWQRRLYCVC